VRVGLAGQLLLTAGERTLDEEVLGGRRGRLAFAYLVAERDRPVTREELADALWGEELPPTWQPALRTVLSTVRAALTAAGLPVTLTGTAGRYRLVLPPGTEVDIEQAERDVAAARRLVAAGVPERAAEHAEAARSVAARSFLPGAEGQWVDRVRGRFAAVLVAALELASESLVATGEAAAAVRPAEDAVALEPFRESAHLRLMLAHAAAGNRGEALRAYERFRKLLAEELGVDPSPRLAAAYLELLRSEPDPPLLPAPGPSIAAGWASAGRSAGRSPAGRASWPGCTRPGGRRWAAAGRSSPSPARPGSARPGWRPSSAGSPRPRAAPCSTGAATRS
jgi:SARP family transcriptional regulator, regulator of embCAB operon